MKKEVQVSCSRSDCKTRMRAHHLAYEERRETQTPIRARHRNKCWIFQSVFHFFFLFVQKSPNDTETTTRLARDGRTNHQCDDVNLLEFLILFSFASRLSCFRLICVDWSRTHTLTDVCYCGCCSRSTKAKYKAKETAELPEATKRFFFFSKMKKTKTKRPLTARL